MSGEAAIPAFIAVVAVVREAAFPAAFPAAARKGLPSLFLHLHCFDGAVVPRGEKVPSSHSAACEPVKPQRRWRFPCIHCRGMLYMYTDTARHGLEMWAWERHPRCLQGTHIYTGR